MLSARKTVLSLLDRLRWQIDPYTWTVACRDERGHPAHIAVTFAVDGVRLEPSQPGRMVLEPLAVGDLRGAVRDALLLRAQLVEAEHDPQPRNAYHGTAA
ncbi:MAG: hypothetical protein GEU98_17050 [Pseudonocardiaceae bacterium]|nr:hypothetical protein [Pseudonocardiaceae bacterium]